MQSKVDNIKNILFLENV